MYLLLKPNAARVPNMIDPIVAKIAMMKLFFAARPHGFLAVSYTHLRAHET